MENDRTILKTLVPPQALEFPFTSWLSDFAKRLMDIVVALFGLVLLSPIFLVLGVLIKRDSPGPVFYRGPRMGMDERIFQILKFRTMHETPDSYAGPGITGKNDPRITPLGQWLRDTKLNELPQMWNVLMGEMSLVGPRPEIPEITQTWPAALRLEILSVRPGITSPASILYRDEEKILNTGRVMDDYMENILPDKLRLDLLYIRHHTLITDLDALFWTSVIMLPPISDQKIPERWLFGGPVSRLMNHYLNWLVIDFVVALLSIGFVGVLWRLTGPLDIGLDKAVSMAIILAFLFSFFNTLLGLKSVSWSHPAAEDVLRLFVSCGLVTVVVVALQVTYRAEAFLPIRFMYAASLSVLFGFVAVRYRLRLITGLASRWIDLRKSSFGAPERVLVVGAGEGLDFAAWLLNRRDFKRIYTVVGIVDDDPAKQGMRIEGLKVLGTTSEIPELVRTHDIGVIFHTITHIPPEENKRILNICNATGLHLVMLSDVLNLLHHQLKKGGLRNKGADAYAAPGEVKTGQEIGNTNS